MRSEWFDRLAKLRELTFEQVVVIAASLLLLPVFSLLLRVRGLDGMLQSIEGRSSQPRHLPSATLRDLGRAINLAARILGVKCLTRSLLLHWLVRRMGGDTRLAIGVGKPSGAFGAHAWVESEGVPVNDQPDVIDAFVRFPAAGAHGRDR